MSDVLHSCMLCPRACKVDRTAETGFCGESSQVRVARAALHYWEEPPISAESGSGTVFFTGCPLTCVYCQNKPVSQGNLGKTTSIQRLAEIFLEQQERGALNINLVTPTHFAPQIVEALDIDRNRLTIPVVYNTSGYESVDTIKMLEGYVDVYLTDFKYASSKLAQRYSHASDYPAIATTALDAMYSSVGPVCYDRSKTGEEILAKGVIVRHLLLPGYLSDSMHVMRILASKPYKDDIIVSLMNQFTPDDSLATAYPELNSRISESDYDALVDYALDLGLDNSFMQEGGTAEQSFIPAFDFEGV